MNREIKFRAWDNLNKNMHEVHRINFSERITVDSKLFKDDTRFLTLENAILLQYTGLKDKKGVEIYEGDIVQPSNRAKDHFVIVWKDSGFHRKYTFIRKYDGEEWEETTHLPIYPSGHVIIGNIYENPELLEGRS